MLQNLIRFLKCYYKASTINLFFFLMNDDVCDFQKVADLDGAIQMFVSTLPGQKEFQICSDIVNECNHNIQKSPSYEGPFNTSFSSINELQGNLHSVSGAFSDEINLLVHSCTKNPEALPSSALQTAKNLHQFVLISLDFYLSSKDRNAVEPQKMLQVLDKLVYSSSILMDTSRQVFAASGASNAADTSGQLHPKLSASARAVVTGINAMMELVLQSSPGLKHCDSAIRNIEVCQYKSCRTIVLKYQNASII